MRAERADRPLAGAGAAVPESSGAAALESTESRVARVETLRPQSHTSRMIKKTIALTVLFTAVAVSAHAQAEHADRRRFESTYGRGITFDVFLGDADRQVRRWNNNFDNGAPSAAALQAVAAMVGNYRLLVVTVPGCSDSVNTVPYIARLVDATPKLEMQIVDSGVGRFVMSAYRTPDDRGATPTVVVLDENYEFVGVWIERPAELQDWWLAHPEIGVSEKVRQKQVWYDEDKGEQTVGEILALIVAAEAAR